MKECFTLGGGGSRRAGPTGTTTLEVEWNRRRFSFCGAGPLAGEGRCSTLAGGSLALVGHVQLLEREEGGRGGRRRHREACMSKVIGCERACEREREGGGEKGGQ